MTAADEVLLRLLRRNWDGGDPLPDLGGDAVDWTRLVETALQHGVAGLLCRTIRQLPPADVPEGIAEAAGVYLDKADADGAKRVGQMFDVLDVLASAAIPVLAFKGAVLGELAYASPTIRPSGDIDLLVHRHDMARTVSVLQAQGYAPDEQFAPWMMERLYDIKGQVALFAEGRTPVEPHWMFTQKALAVDLDMKGIWDRARRVEVAGRGVPSLSLDDTVYATCMNGSKEKWWRLLGVADLAALIHRHSDLDWTAINRRADGAGVNRMLLLGLALARDLFSVPLPVSTVDAIERDGRCLALMRACKQRLFGASVPADSVTRFSRYHFDARERLADRARYVWRTTTTPGVNHLSMVDLPEPLFHGYAAVKVVHDYVLLPAWNLGKGRWWRRRSPIDGSS